MPASRAARSETSRGLISDKPIRISICGYWPVKGILPAYNSMLWSGRRDRAAGRVLLAALFGMRIENRPTINSVIFGNGADEH